MPTCNLHVLPGKKNRAPLAASLKKLSHNPRVGTGWIKKKNLFRKGGVHVKYHGSSLGRFSGQIVL